MSRTKGYYQAIALGLSEDDLEGPPTISARGEYHLADSIVAIARRYGVPVVERPELCDSLQSIALDAPIPKVLFRAVAILLRELGALAPKRL